MKSIEEIKKRLKDLDLPWSSEYIISEIFDIPQHKLYTDNIVIDKEKELRIKKALRKLKNGHPLPYITNRAFFYNIKLYIEEGVFIPRQETETLVIETVKFLKEINFYPQIILDLGCGSGAIALFLKKFFPESKIFASDINKKACKIALKNSLINNLRINVICGDMFLPFNKSFDLIISNPPYVMKDEFDNLPPEVKKEPFNSLYGGKDGLMFYRKIFSELKKYLQKEGVIVVEIHPFLEEKIKKIAGKFELLKGIYDLNGFKRGLIFRNS